MIREGIVLIDEGPEEWSEEKMRIKRYIITDVLEDFIGCDDRGEGVFIAGALADSLHEFVLRTHGQWVETSKWIVRALKADDEVLAGEFVDAFECLYREGNRDLIVQLTDAVLRPQGGRLFEGFSSGKGDATT